MRRLAIALVCVISLYASEAPGGREFLIYTLKLGTIVQDTLVQSFGEEEAPQKGDLVAWKTQDEKKKKILKVAKIKELKANFFGWHYVQYSDDGESTAVPQSSLYKLKIKSRL